MWTDPIIEELYSLRKDMVAKFNYDSQALWEYYQQQQKLQNCPLVSRPPQYCHPLSLTPTTTGESANFLSHR